MFNRKKTILAVVVLLVVGVLGSQTFLPTGFLNDSSRVFALIYGSSGNKTVVVTKITLDKKSLAMKVNEKTKLVVKLEPVNATRKTPSWFSSNKKVAVVAKDGTITAVGAGTTTITAFTETQYADCQITVAGLYVPTPTPKPAIKPTVKPTIKPTVKPTTKPVAVTGVAIDKSLTLKVKATKTLIALIKPTNATNKTLTWISSNSSVASVDSKGKITAMKAGKATITVKTKDGNKTASCIVTVIK